SSSYTMFRVDMGWMPNPALAGRISGRRTRDLPAQAPCRQACVWHLLCEWRLLRGSACGETGRSDGRRAVASSGAPSPTGRTLANLLHRIPDWFGRGLVGNG